MTPISVRGKKTTANFLFLAYGMLQESSPPYTEMYLGFE